MAAVMKIETDSETCCVCGSDGGGELLTPEEHDAGAAPLQVSLRAMLLHLNNNKVLPEGRLCLPCIQRAVNAYEFSSGLSACRAPPLSEKIRALRRRLQELTQKIDVFIVVGGPGVSAGAYSEEDIIMVDKDALAAAAAADDEDLEKAKNAKGETVYQCSVCPLSFQRVSEFRAHCASHPAGARHSCWACGAQFASRDALAQHAALHRADDALICYLCDTSFQCASELRRHCRACAGAGRCPVCGAAAPSRAALSAHAAAPCGATRLCPLCFRGCRDAAELAAHRLTHRQADHFVCGYDGCILRFGTRGTLLSHIRAAHAGAAPAAQDSTHCPHCSRTFGSVGAMKRHARVHLRDAHEHAQHDDDGHVEYLEMDALDEH